MADNSWKTYRIGELGTVVTGRTPSSSLPHCFGDQYPFITPTDMDGRKVVNATERYLSEQGAAQLKSNSIPARSVCVSCIGWQMGKVMMTDRPSFTNQQLNSIIPNRDVDADYLYYALSTRRAEFKMLASVGTRTPILNKSAFSAIEVLVPPLSTQRRVAATLSAYDGLIENSTRRIQILEEMAQALYREWFVHFRFLGHEKVTQVKSALRNVPAGWEVKRLTDVVTLSRDGINPGHSPDEVFAHFSIPAFDNGCMPVLEEGRTIKSNKYLVPETAVLLSKLNPRIPRVWLPIFEGVHRAIASTEFLVLTPRPPLTREFLFALCQSAEFMDEFTGRSVGTSTSHQRVKPEDVLRMHVAAPPAGIVNLFTRCADPMLRLAHTLRVKNAALRRIRDLLLPKLISGEVDVSEIEVEHKCDGPREPVPNDSKRHAAHR